MTPTVTVPAPGPLLEAMEENLHGHIAFLQARVAGMTVQDGGDLLLVDSHLPTDTFNKIARARLDEENAEARIEVALEYFRRVQRPFAWWVGPCSRPLDLQCRLEKHGLRPAEYELGMAADPKDLPAKIDLPAGLEVGRVRTRKELAGFAAVNAANWDPPDEAIAAFYERAAPILLQEECPMQLFVGYAGGTLAAASELFLSGDVAGIHMVSTRKAFRGRGIGLAMTWLAVREGRRQGARTATLQASEEGRRVYTRLGFSECCGFVEYA